MKNKKTSGLVWAWADALEWAGRPVNSSRDKEQQLLLMHDMYLRMLQSKQLITNFPPPRQILFRTFTKKNAVPVFQTGPLKPKRYRLLKSTGPQTLLFFFFSFLLWRDRSRRFRSLIRFFVALSNVYFRYPVSSWPSPIRPLDFGFRSFRWASAVPSPIPRRWSRSPQRRRGPQQLQFRSRPEGISGGLCRRRVLCSLVCQPFSFLFLRRWFLSCSPKFFLRTL